MTKLEDIPVEILADQLLPLIPAPELLRGLAQTCRLFASLSYDEALWKRKCREDYNFTGAGTARTSGWRLVYRGLFNPRVFVWGEKSKGRLGFETFPPSSIWGGIAFPIELKQMQAKMVTLVAGGMSFHGLDSDGTIHVTGTLNGTVGAYHREGFNEAGKSASIPHRLRMPAPTRSISCGRLHSTSFDVNNDVWTFLNWGHPFRLPGLTEYLSSSAGSGNDGRPTIQQVECGWTFSAILTDTGGEGEVLVWWPFEEAIRQAYRETLKAHNQSSPTGGRVDALPADEVSGHGPIIPCEPLSIQGNNNLFFVLPPLPPLPTLKNYEADDNDYASRYHLRTGQQRSRSDQQGIRLVQIAGLDNHLIGLTNHGHVLKFGDISSQEMVRSHGRWEYLPHFSEDAKVRMHPAFVSGEQGNSPSAEPPKATVEITHITGNWRHFTAYSTNPQSSVVLMGTDDITPDKTATVVPELQNRSVISVVIGDYHYGALTADGKLLTWGDFSLGALGLGDPMMLPIGAPGGFRHQAERNLMESTMMRGGRAMGGPSPPRVETPTEVRFDHKPDEVAQWGGWDYEQELAKERKEKGESGEDKEKNLFCFAATAAGWHMGALVIDLEPDSEDDIKAPVNSNDQSEMDEEDKRYGVIHRAPGVGFHPYPSPNFPRNPHDVSGGPSSQSSHSENTSGSSQTTTIGGLGGLFRIGYAGRGGFRGGRGAAPF